MTLIEVTAAIFDEAGRLAPASPLSLDAVHLATALALGDDLEGFVTYDSRQASTALIDIPVSVWRAISGSLLIGLGLIELWPEAWSRIMVATGLNARSAGGLAVAYRSGGWVGAVLTGVALGPVFTSCSPLYGYVVVTVLPAEPVRGMALLAAYVVGLTVILLAVALLGQRAVRNLRWAADPRARWRRALGLLFVVIGVLVLTGWMQDVETWVLEHSPVAPWGIGSDIGR